MYEAGTIALIAILIVMLKFPTSVLRKLLWIDIPIDILVTATFVSLFAGTYNGMMTALVAGLIFSIVLYILKICIGYESLRITFTPFRIWWERH